MRALPILLLALCTPAWALPPEPTPVADPVPVDPAAVPEAPAMPEAAPEPIPGPDSPVHDELRAIMAAGVKALSTKDFAEVKPLLDPNFSIVTLDNRKFDNVDGFITAWKGLFEGKDAMFTSVELKPVADDLTHFVDARTGFTHGMSTDTYHFAGGQTKEMQTRWTAVVRRGDDGKWRLLLLHFSVDPFDNPMITAAVSGAGKAGMWGVLLGAGIGLLVGAGGLMAIGFRRKA